MTAPDYSPSPSVAAANRAFGLARQYCGACRAYHSLWPYLRLIDPTRGVDSDRPILLPMLREILQPGAQVLLAGSADAGIAELVLDAAGGRPVSLTVMDICETPLRQCEAIAPLPPGTTLRTLRGSITGQPQGGRHDLVVAHSVLSFLPEDQIDAAGQFIAGSLKPGGRLVLTTGLTRKRRKSRDEDYRRHVLSEFDRLGVTFPCDRAEFEGQLDGHIAQRGTRNYAFGDRQELLSWLDRHGMGTAELTTLHRGNLMTPDGEARRGVDHGVLVVATRQADWK